MRGCVGFQYRGPAWGLAKILDALAAEKKYKHFYPATDGFYYYGHSIRPVRDSPGLHGVRILLFLFHNYHLLCLHNLLVKASLTGFIRQVPLLTFCFLPA